MGEVQIQSTITINQETINEIADRIFVRLKEVADSYAERNNNNNTSEKESFSLKQEETEETNQKTEVSHRRRQNKYIELGGASMAFRNGWSIFCSLNIERREYENVFNNLNFKNHEHDIVNVEAERVRKALSRHGYKCDSYSAYNFDGKLITIKF